jgi:SAM-dependent methyltransferase
MGIAEKVALVAKVVSGKVPPRALWHGALGLWNRWRDPSDLRRQFDRLYAEDGDHWKYWSDAGQKLKYHRTLNLALAWRQQRPGTPATSLPRALEIGCSVGEFTALMVESRAFSRIVAVDFSDEAIRLARKRLAGMTLGIVTLSQLDIRDASSLLGAFDIIFLAEVHYYVHQDYARKVAKELDRLVARGGIIVVVHASDSAVDRADEGFCQSAEELIDMRRFFRAREAKYPDKDRPYSISEYRRHEDWT